MRTFGFDMQVGALPRLCDVRRVLLEERAQCLQELSSEKKGDLGLETASGRRPPRCALQVDPVQSSGVGNLPSGPGGMSRVGLDLSAQLAVQSGTWST